MNSNINTENSNLLIGEVLPQIITLGLNNDVFFGKAGGLEINNIVNAKAGNDTINTIFGLNDIINGGSGSDYVLAGAGNDIINGDSGNDYVLGLAGDDIIDGGLGIDLLFGDGFLTQEQGNDLIRGGAGNNFINAFGGNDTVYGGSGFERITGGEGIDLLFGAAGSDVLTGAEGDDTVYGGSGDDAVLGFADNDLVFGDSGNDVISGGVGNDSVFGGNGDDILIGFDVFSPEPLIIPGEIDILTGDAGNDVFVLGGTLPGGNLGTFYTDNNPNSAGLGDYAIIDDFSWEINDNGADLIQLVGSSSDYTLTASPTDLPSGTAIYYNDGATPDLIGIVADVTPEQLSLDNPNQFTFVTNNQNLAANNELAPIATIGTNNGAYFGAGFGINNIVNAGAGNDTINTIPGLDDIINAGQGEDSIITGTGDDIVNGGSGSDFVLAGDDNDVVNGGSGDDFLFGDDETTEPGDDLIRGEAGNDYIDAQGGNDTVYGGKGFDRITGEQGEDLLFGNAGKDVLTGADGDDTVYGGTGDDAIFGFADNDLVFGDNGNDVISGGVGNDLVFGGDGDDILLGFDVFSPEPLIIPGEIDTLTGGRGNDVFVLGGALPGVFYTDNNLNSAGIEDYALIDDFGWETNNNGADIIQLAGTISDYTLGTSPTGLPSGTAIYYNDGSTPDLIGIVADVTPEQLSLDNPNQFTFV